MRASPIRREPQTLPLRIQSRFGLGSDSKAGFESVRMVAVDEDWSALRFRRLVVISRRPRGLEVFLALMAKASIASTQRCVS